MDVAAGHTLDETDEAARSSTNLAQGTAHTAGSTSNGRTSSASDSRQTILRLRSSLAGSLRGLLGGRALEAAAGESHSRRAEHRARKGLHYG